MIAREDDQKGSPELSPERIDRKDRQKFEPSRRVLGQEGLIRRVRPGDWSRRVWPERFDQ